MIFPTTTKEMKTLGWSQCDLIIMTGDAFVDHPSFGTAIIARVLEKEGFKVGIIDQPDWKDASSAMRLGAPRLCFAATAGNIDSMVAHYTVNHKKRSDDAYSPGGKAGRRPNRATIVYTNLIRAAYKDVPVILGGIEASLRRMAHYDFWTNKVRRSILIDSKADLLVYGMGELPIKEVIHRLDKGENIREIYDVPGTVCRVPERSEGIELPSFEEIQKDKSAFNLMTQIHYNNRLYPYAKDLYQRHDKQIIRINAPAKAMSTKEMDNIYALPFSNKPHPKYNETIPAYEQIKDSITAHRGCFGNCSFCAITFHQGPRIQSRSQKSIVDQVKSMSKDPDFKGTITDIGGPTANMYGIHCKIGGCKDMNCLFPEVCKNLIVKDQDAYVRLLKEASKVPGVKHVYIASGLRHDLALQNEKAMEKMVTTYTGGHLKIAPEHLADNVTRLMNKPPGKVYLQFLEKFRSFSRRAGKKQYIVPYFISGHPGCTDEDMLLLKTQLQKSGHKLQQAADFYPTPMTIATAMYYTGSHPLTGEKIYVPRTAKEKLKQFGMMMWHQPAKSGGSKKTKGKAKK
ncbi:MAG: YgiQ family radical SAM protein [Candidatus Neomarinimicrobiota bacterium]